MNQVTCLLGPTSSGKTDLAIALSQKLPIEIISVDSTQVYCDLNIGSGKPSRDILEKSPHHLIDILPPDQAYSAAQFAEDTNKLIAAIHQRERIPLLVGGTMMYFHTLINGLHTLPAADAILREDLEREGHQMGWPMMHQKLQQVDPEAALRIKPNDKQRIQRALEIYHTTQRPMSSFLHEQRVSSPFSFLCFALIPLQTDRAVLHHRINQRFQGMLEQGFVEEVQHLREKYVLHENLPSMRAVGYRHVWQYLEGTISRDVMQEGAKAATRQLAKRQLTWLRRWPDIVNLDFMDKNNLDIVVNTLNNK